MLSRALGKRHKAALIGLIAFGASAWPLGACNLPSPPQNIPDGTTASEAEMISAMQTLRRYNTDVDTFVKCLNFEVTQNRLSLDEQAHQHDAAVAQLREIAARFNEQVRVFKARTAS